MSIIEVVHGNITKETVDAIVNAANTTLLGGGGVDGAIHQAAGPKLLEECRAIGGCPTGESRITRGYNLPAKYIIHTVGPVYGDGTRDESGKLRSCYCNSMLLANHHSLHSISFPSISTGAYRYPIEDAARIAVESVRESLEQATFVNLVRFVCFSDRDLKVYRRILEL